MRRLLLGLVVFFLSVGTGQAAVSVSPVIIEAVQVQLGQSFEIVCQNAGTEELDFQLSLALFDQSEDGSVFFMEDSEAIQRVEETLILEKKDFTLPAGGMESLKLRLAREDFDHLYAVLFVKPRQPGIQTRFAVLFLLSTSGKEASLAVASLEHKEELLAFSVQNSGLRHGLWEGELLCFDAGDILGETLSIRSGVVLAGRSRDVEVSLPSWVARVELFPTPTERGQ